MAPTSPRLTTSMAARPFTTRRSTRWQPAAAVARATRGPLSVVQALMRHGADPAAVDGEGYLASDYALQAAMHDVARCLSDAVASAGCGTGLAAAAEAGGTGVATDAESFWIDVVDEASGHTYEYNQVTGETRWKTAKTATTAMGAVAWLQAKTSPKAKSAAANTSGAGNWGDDGAKAAACEGESKTAVLFAEGVAHTGAAAGTAAPHGSLTVVVPAEAVRAAAQDAARVAQAAAARVMAGAEQEGGSEALRHSMHHAVAATEAAHAELVAELQGLALSAVRHQRRRRTRRWPLTPGSPRKPQRR